MHPTGRVDAVRGRFPPGTVVTLYDRQRGTLLSATRHLVVEDSSDCIALYVAPGASRREPVTLRDDLVRRLLESDWELGSSSWHSNHVLRLTPPLASHSVDLYWRAGDWAFQGWYVNLQKPLLRLGDGFETTDQVLDIWVDPDRRWAWKDEVDFDALTAAGYWQPPEAVSIRAEGEALVGQINAWLSPFCDGWERWRPEPEWIPALTADTAFG
jgi:hypothetical protein